MDPIARSEDTFDDAERDAWFGFISLHARITGELDARLAASHGMPLTEFEVMLQLLLAGGSLRMSELADACVVSRSGLTRIVDELEHQGLVERAADEDDGRVFHAAITRAGRTRLRAAKRAHIANVRRLFLDPMAGAQREAMAASWAAIRATLDEESPATRRRRPRPRRKAQRT